MKCTYSFPLPPLQVMYKEEEERGGEIRRKGGRKKKPVQWGPALVQPFVLSPNWWICIPRSADGSFPWILKVITVGACSEACSKCTVPLTEESPRRTATIGTVSPSREWCGWGRWGVRKLEKECRRAMSHQGALDFYFFFLFAQIGS